jgi:hypothetical protein
VQLFRLGWCPDPVLERVPAGGRIGVRPDEQQPRTAGCSQLATAFRVSGPPEQRHCVFVVERGAAALHWVFEHVFLRVVTVRASPPDRHQRTVR